MIDRGLKEVKFSLGEIEDFINHRLSCGSEVAVLEIGCGIGNALSDLRNLYPDIRLIGMNKKRYKKQISDKNITFIYGDAGGNIPLEDNTIDFAYSIHAFQFISDKVNLLKEAHRVLKYHGELRMYIPETLPGLNNEMLCTISDKAGTVSLPSYLLSLNNPNISFYQRHLDRLAPHQVFDILKLKKILSDLAFTIDVNYTTTALEEKFPGKEGYIATHYRLSNRNVAL